MSTESLIIEHLRAMRAEIASVKADTTDMRQRLCSIDTSVIDMRRNGVHLFEEMAHHQVTMDKMLDRVQRIEKRLDLC